MNASFYDHLMGIINRYRHPISPELHIGLILTHIKNTKKYSKAQIEYDINALERKLKKAKREVRF